MEELIRCSRCELNLPLDCYWKSFKREKPRCKKCVKRKEGSVCRNPNDWIVSPLDLINSDSLIKCFDCEAFKTPDNFKINPKVQRVFRCNSCDAERKNERSKKSQAKHRERVLARRRLNRTGDPDLKVLTLNEETGMKKCWAITNLQPLWAEDNLSKNARYAG